MAGLVLALKASTGMLPYSTVEEPHNQPGGTSSYSFGVHLLSPGHPGRPQACANLACMCNRVAHQKADSARKDCKELAPAVIQHSPGRPDRYGRMTTDQSYGAETHPVRLVLKWGTEPGSALRRLYALSQQPAFTSLVSEVWRHVWPKTLWSDLLCDGLSGSWPLDIADGWTSPLCINVDIQIANDEPLQLPWKWLALNLLYAPAVGLRHYLNTTAPQLQGPKPDAQDLEQESQQMLAGFWTPQLLSPSQAAN